MDKILVIGACGQIGVEITQALRSIYGEEMIIAADISSPHPDLSSGIFENLDVLNAEAVYSIIKKHTITQVYNLAAVLSAVGERNPKKAWGLNMDGLINVLDAAKELRLEKVFWPSSIAVFGPSTPSQNTPQKTVMDPGTVYGISKLAGERWCAYYFYKYGVDVRSLRYPGLVSYKAKPGGGTTDYAVEMYQFATDHQFYECFLESKTFLPLLYMPDAIKATIALMNAKAEDITIRDSYNLGGICCCPRDIAKEIQKVIQDFKIKYTPDYRQSIADSWPNSIDDAVAKHDFGLQQGFDLESMTIDMLNNLKKS